MAYGDFTLRSVTAAFGLSTIVEPLFPQIPESSVPVWLTETLARNMEISLPSEKARGELIVMPILLAARELTGRTVMIYSGVRMDVDAKLGLHGESDYLVCRGVALPEPAPPVVAVVEAKKADIELGMGQCVAQMVGAKVWNEREGKPLDAAYGCVTSGEVWQFLRLKDSVVTIDRPRCYLDNIPRILGLFQAMLAPADSAAA